MRSIYGERLSPTHGAQVDVCCFDNEFWITRIIVPLGHRKRGVGTRLLQRVCDDADEQGVSLTLEPVPSDPTFSKRKLIAWYKKFGFKHAGFGVMRREPCSTGKTYSARRTTTVRLRSGTYSVRQTASGCSFEGL
jgi:GNAT superfamily N-acetyltransferase